MAEVISAAVRPARDSTAKRRTISQDNNNKADWTKRQHEGKSMEKRDEDHTPPAWSRGQKGPCLQGTDYVHLQSRFPCIGHHSDLPEMPLFREQHVGWKKQSFSITTWLLLLGIKEQIERHMRPPSVRDTAGRMPDALFLSVVLSSGHHQVIKTRAGSQRMPPSEHNPLVTVSRVFPNNILALDLGLCRVFFYFSNKNSWMAGIIPIDTMQTWSRTTSERPVRAMQ